ncbi:hypothetical protein Shyhy01_49370 [Streptomyces hygroscopicus subsp. hygroscopicus]|nr:hypothetical protein Shyhy01_49370 [Streptomyces hygroscopicus subsp. hygroscopicus]
MASLFVLTTAPQTFFVPSGHQYLGAAGRGGQDPRRGAHLRWSMPRATAHGPMTRSINGDRSGNGEFQRTFDGCFGRTRAVR